MLLQTELQLTKKVEEDIGGNYQARGVVATVGVQQVIY